MNTLQNSILCLFCFGLAVNSHTMAQQAIPLAQEHVFLAQQRVFEVEDPSFPPTLTWTGEEVDKQGGYFSLARIMTSSSEEIVLLTEEAKNFSTTNQYAYRFSMEGTFLGSDQFAKRENLRWYPVGAGQLPVMRMKDNGELQAFQFTGDDGSVETHVISSIPDRATYYFDGYATSPDGRTIAAIHNISDEYLNVEIHRDWEQITSARTPLPENMGGRYISMGVNNEGYTALLTSQDEGTKGTRPRASNDPLLVIMDPEGSVLFTHEFDRAEHDLTTADLYVEDGRLLGVIGLRSLSDWNTDGFLVFQYDMDRKELIQEDIWMATEIRSVEERGSHNWMHIDDIVRTEGGYWVFAEGFRPTANSDGDAIHNFRGNVVLRLNEDFKVTSQTYVHKHQEYLGPYGRTHGGARYFFNDEAVGIFYTALHRGKAQLDEKNHLYYVVVDSDGETEKTLVRAMERKEVPLCYLWPLGSGRFLAIAEERRGNLYLGRLEF